MAGIGINFRDSSSYVTDGAGQTYCVGDNYPTTRGGWTFGWTTSIGSDRRDRSDAVTPELSGINFVRSGNTHTFRLDLPATGNYAVRLALGDYLTAPSAAWADAVLKDDTSTIATYTVDLSGTSADPPFVDAAGNTWAASAWLASNVPIEHTFSSTTLNLTLDGDGHFSMVAHLAVEQVASASGLLLRQQLHNAQRHGGAL
uniref:Uncharacterized protein n=1 Tax=Rubinisphaera brasiliensis (strain ATCC 49424 / DSM 5305 / JCM 21570 / IAM 15109 / NBRC 103401 / IFAM 1448) TaxID=756272 RepID=F0SNK9_RUBBR|nr:hypothetical protein Plabr_0214 [Rubinisphaera brasiliensis DSM 5305]